MVVGGCRRCQHQGNTPHHFLAYYLRIPIFQACVLAVLCALVFGLQRGETLAKAMKRLGGGHSAKPLTKREKARQEQQAGESKATGAEGAAAVFARITEIAAQLVDEGEMDVYDSTREDFASFAAMWLPKQPAAGAGAGVGAAAAKASVEDDDDDMFAEEDSKPAAAKQDSAAEGVITGQAGDSGVMTAAGTAESSEFSSWPVKELKRYLQVYQKLCIQLQECV